MLVTGVSTVMIELKPYEKAVVTKKERVQVASRKVEF